MNADGQMLPAAPEPASATLERRLALRRSGWLDIASELRHFALITYAVPPERLWHHLPNDRFDLPLFEIDGRPRALLSVVPFVDWGFHFRMAPFARFRFCQTNYRAYVLDRRTGEHVVWFFGTTLGSWTVHLARSLWRIPWYPARYQVEARVEDGRYTRFRYQAASDWGDAEIELADTGEEVTLVPGFSERDRMRLVLTHPVDGYFYCLDGEVGTYSVSHAPLEIRRGEARTLYFAALERLGILSRDEMRRPHSVFLCPKTTFRIHMPPHRVR